MEIPLRLLDGHVEERQQVLVRERHDVVVALLRAVDDALVLRVSWGQSAILLTGDLNRAGEAMLVGRGREALRAHVLKVANHGAATSSSSEFLRASAPGAAIISSGRFNAFGYPSPLALRRLQEAKIATFRTDLDGAIEVECDTSNCQVTPTRD